jgi:signal transduction histidine kinase
VAVLYTRNEMSSQSSASLHFTVDSHLLLELGERLVARKSIALAELVKNAYDADATKVLIGLQNVRRKGGTITVEDNGEGMTYDALVRGWMLIATGEKRDNPVSRKHKRARTGAKGIGRFASRVLSNRLVLESVAVVASGQKEKIVAAFDWDSFKSGSKVDDISIPYHREKVEYDTPTGTRLMLQEIREAWEQRDLDQLRRDLLTLVSDYTPELETPDEKSKRVGDPGFQIVIQAPEFPEFEGPIAEQFLKYSWGRLIGKILPDGRATYQLLIRKTSKQQQYTSEPKFSEVGEASFKVDFFVYRKEYFAGLPISLAEAREIGRGKGGVAIYLDRFRVFPYGDATEDWLNLDHDRARRITAFRELSDVGEDLERPELYIPGNNQLFGAVFLSRKKNPSITITVTRERFLENKAFDQLKSFVRLGIEWMTVQYARFAPETRGEPKVRDPLAPLETAKKKVLKREAELGPEATAEIVQSIDLARQAFEDRENERISELSMLRVLATTGTMISVFEHELSVMIRALLRESKALLNYVEKIPQEYRTDLENASKTLQGWEESIEEYASQLGRMMGRDSRDRQRSYPLKPLIDEMVRPFAHHFLEAGVDFENNVQPTLRLPPMFRCEIYSIFLNLISNSVKAVKRSTSRKIAVTGSTVNSEVRICILDSGPGLPPDKREEVFKAFVSYSEPDLLFGEGTGLGLTIVRNTVDTYGGTVQFVDPPQGWNTCVEIILPVGE